MDELEKPDFTKEELIERFEHRDALLNLRAVLATSQGQNLFKYLFKAFDVAQLPIEGLEGEALREALGFLRAGSSIFKLASEANPALAGALLAQVEKERYAKLHEEYVDGRN
jgi:hypothetical protein